MEILRPEILKLKRLLIKAGVNFEVCILPDFKDSAEPGSLEKYTGLKHGVQIILYNKNGVRLADAVQNTFTYGFRKNLIEIMGGLTAEEKRDDDVLGYLTAEDVAERFIYCYKNDTSVYKK